MIGYGNGNYYTSIRVFVYSLSRSLVISVTHNSANVSPPTFQTITLIPLK